jgi:cytoskeletal protein RodZ
MPSIGDTLREARMRQRLDIADVEEKTKIRAKYLRALENEEFSMLPGPTFVKTFLRTYAEVLGLDPQMLMDDYRANYESRGDDLEHLQPLGPRTTARERRPARGGGGGPRPLVIIITGIVIVFAVLVVLGITGNNNDGGGGEAANTDTTATTPKKKKKKQPPPAPTTVKLRITPTDATYICVDRGEGTAVVFQGTVDTAQTFHGKRLRVNLGKSSVEIRKNGKPVPIEQTPNPVGFEFTPKSTKSLPLGQRPCA